jgi:hypothetical protein
MRVSLALLSGLLLGAGCAVPSAQHTRVEEQTIETEPLNAIELVTFNGPINVQPHDAPSVEMEITYKARGNSDEEARANCEQMTCEVSAEDGTLIIQAMRPKSQWTASVAFNLKVPVHCPIKLRTSNGKVTVQDMQASVDAQTSNGTVVLERIDAPVIAHSSNGTIDVQQCRGSIDLKTSNGKVIYSGLLSGRENVIRTSNGAVTLELDPASITEFEANTSNGSVRCSLATQRVIEESKKSLHAIVGDGVVEDASSKVSIRTSNGSIKIGPIQTSDEPSASETPASETPASETPASETPASDRAEGGSQSTVLQL